MTYETVVEQLFARFPNLRADYESRLPYMLQEPPLPYIVFGSVLVPALENALENGQLTTVESLCAFLEEASAESDSLMLTDPIAIEIGEWLAETEYEMKVAPLLGTHAKRVCRYVSGLATQRHQPRAE